MKKHTKNKVKNRTAEAVVADAGYGSEENYQILENKEVEAYVKYNYFHKEQKRKIKDNPFLAQNLFYNPEKDFFVCPMGQRMEKTGTSKRISGNGYPSELTHYQAKRCEGCPLRGMCHQAKGNRTIQVNHRLNKLKGKAKELLTSEKGLKHRSKRPAEVEAVFGQMKSNNKFNRFTMRGSQKVELEFLLMALGHNLRKMAALQHNSVNPRDKSAQPTSDTVSTSQLNVSQTIIKPFYRKSIMDNRCYRLAA